MGMMPKRPTGSFQRGTPPPPPAQVRRPSGKPFLLETKNYRLRSLRPSDAGPRMASWFQDPIVLAGLNLPDGGITVDSLRGYIAEYDNHSRFLIGVFPKQEEKLVAYYHVTINFEHKVGTLAYIIGDPEYRATQRLDELGDLVTDEFLSNRNVDKMVIRVVAKNFRALWTVKNFTSYQFEALMKKDNLMPDGNRVDIVQFYRLREGLG